MNLRERMTVSSITMSLPLKARIPRQTVETASLPSSQAVTNADARRLAAAVARGDEAAFRDFYEHYHGRLLRFALVLAHGNETLAHDAVQAAFVTAAKNFAMWPARNICGTGWRALPGSSWLKPGGNTNGIPPSSAWRSRRIFTMMPNPIPCWKKASTRHCWRWMRASANLSNGFISTN